MSSEEEPFVPASKIAVTIRSFSESLEDNMFHALTGSVTAKCSSKGYDAATEVRCREALSVREELVELGVFSVASMILENKMHQSSILHIL